MEETTDQTSTYHLTLEHLESLHSIDRLNAHIGIAGALVVDEYKKQRQFATSQPTYSQPYNQGYPPQPYNAPQQYQPAPHTPAQQQPIPPIVQDLASLANILTQIQYDVFDISITIAQHSLPEQLDSRIDEKSIRWVTDIATKIAEQLPAHSDPILPIGNQLATQFYLAKNDCQVAIVTLQKNHPQLGLPQDLADKHMQYLTQLQAFLFSAFRWSNIILKEKDWFWKPRSQMQQEAQTQQNQNNSQPSPFVSTENIPQNNANLPPR